MLEHEHWTLRVNEHYSIWNIFDSSKLPIIFHIFTFSFDQLNRCPHIGAKIPLFSPEAFLENSIQHPFMSHFCNWQALRMWFCCIAKATWPLAVPATNLVANVEWLGPWTSNTPLIIGNSGSLIKKMGRLFWKLASFLWERLSGLYSSIASIPSTYSFWAFKPVYTEAFKRLKAFYGDLWQSVISTSRPLVDH